MQICQIDCYQDAVKLMEEIGVTTRGIQLMAPAMEEKRLFRTGRAFELAREQKEFLAPLD